MPRISIENAKPDMIVTEKVMNDKGMVLLNPGTKLTEPLISRLKQWGVQTVLTSGDDSDQNSTQTTSSGKPVLNEDLKIRLKEKFSPHAQNPLMKEIFKAVIIYFQNADKKEET